MEYEPDYNNEYAPVEMYPPFNALEEIVHNLTENPDMVQPVKVLSTETNKPVSSFFVSLVSYSGMTFVQLEDLDVNKFQLAHIGNLEDKNEWKMFQPGIYRLKISSQSLFHL